MFKDSLIESSRRPQKRRLCTILASLAFQSLAVGLLLLIPLMYVDRLPRPPVTVVLLAPPPPPPPPPAAAGAPAHAAVAPARVHKLPELETQVRTPTAIPKQITRVEVEAPPSLAANLGGTVGGGMVGEIDGGVNGGFPGGVLGGTGVVNVAMPKLEAPQKIHVSSGVAQGNLIRDIRPQYPPLARQARIQGIVVLQAVIGKDGSVQNLHVESGPPMLAKSAVEAVKQWRYKPYLLNGEPVEVDTQINVNFTLGG